MKFNTHLIFKNPKDLFKPYRVFISGVVFVYLVSIFIEALQNKSVEEQLFSQNIKMYREKLASFIKQDWVYLGILHSSHMSVKKSFTTMLDSDTICASIYFDNKEALSAGSCIDLDTFKNSSDKIGWVSKSTLIFLNESYSNGLTLKVIKNNPQKFNVREDLATINLNLNHFNFLSLFSFFIVFVYMLFFIIVRIYMIFHYKSEETSYKLHDIGNVIRNNAYLSEKLKINAKSPRKIIDIANEIQCVIKLQKAKLTNLEVINPEYFLIKDVIDQFLTGFFSEHSVDPIFVGEFNENTFVYCDKNLFMKALYNLLSNAFYHSDAGSPVTLSSIEDKDQITIYVSNKAQINANDVNKIFKKGFSTKNSTGLGLSIVSQAISKIGGSLFLIHSPSQVLFGFSLQKKSTNYG